MHSLPVSPSPGVHSLTGEPAPEEHVEYLLRRHVGLEAVGRVELVEAVAAAPAVRRAAPAAAAVGHLRAVEIVLTALLTV